MRGGGHLVCAGGHCPRECRPAEHLGEQMRVHPDLYNGGNGLGGELPAVTVVKCTEQGGIRAPSKAVFAESVRGDHRQEFPLQSLGDPPQHDRPLGRVRLETGL